MWNSVTGQYIDVELSNRALRYVSDQYQPIDCVIHSSRERENSTIFYNWKKALAVVGFTMFAAGGLALDVASTKEGAQTTEVIRYKMITTWFETVNCVMRRNIGNSHDDFYLP